MDTVGNKAAHTEIQAIKIATPATVEWILDKAIQVHGAGGLSQDFPAGVRVRRHPHAPLRRTDRTRYTRTALARAELARQRSRRSALGV